MITFPEQAPASGYITDTLAGIESVFTELSVFHRSDRNVVMRARRYGRYWILKGLAAEALTDSGRVALRKEFEIMMKLSQSVGMRAYSLEEVAGAGPCIVMDYVEGPTLREWLREPHSMAQRCRVAEGIVNALRAVHDSGVVHRDLKPENIIVSRPAYEPVLIDYGLSDTMSHALLKSPAGTKGYMSPEQMNGTEPLTQNDMYSLGRVLQEMKLPLTWRQAIRSCLRPLDRRCADCRTFMRTVSRTRRLLRLLPMAAVLIGAVTVLTLTAGKASRTDRRAVAAERMASEASRRADSLDAVLSTTRRESRDEISALTGALHGVNDSLEAVRMAQVSHEADIAGAIEGEKRQLDRLWKESAMHYLDTVDTRGFVVNAYSTHVMDRHVDRFMQSIQGRYTQAELVRIRMELNEHIARNLNL